MSARGASLRYSSTQSEYRVVSALSSLYTAPRVRRMHKVHAAAAAAVHTGGSYGAPLVGREGTDSLR